MRQITHTVLQTEEIQPCYRLAPTKTATWSWKHRKQRGDHHTGRVSFPLSCKIGSKKREMMEMRKTPKLHLFCYLDCYLENCINETGKLVHQSCPDGILQRSSHGWGPLVYLRGDRDRPLQAKSWLGKNHPLHFQIGFPIGLTTRITTFFW